MRVKGTLLEGSVILAAMILSWAGQSPVTGQESHQGIDPDKRIRYYTNKVSEAPQLYPAYALLGAAYLDKARETQDPAYLKEARSALHRSMQIQESFEAFKVMAALCNFRHQFEEGARWARKAAETWPNDTAATAMLVEARMGLGQYEEARQLLPPADQKPPDFYIAAALGHWYTSQHQYNEAAGAFLQAAGIANDQRAHDLAAWAQVSAAGAWLDGGQADNARSLLDQAAKHDSKNKFLRIHEAEYWERRKQPAKALAVYEGLLTEQEDPDLSRKAFLIARSLGQEQRAQRHFDAAERGFRKAIDAGEVYTLGALAQLYCDANVYLQTALELAQRNLKYKKDNVAQATLDCLRNKR